ncbi:MAG: hypothetical protein ACJ8ER_03250 [Allosphingosinicella sp.]
MKDEEFYRHIGNVVAVLAGLATFVGAWIYCAVTYGFLFGFGLGWLPAAILAVIVGLGLRFAWPFLLIGLVVGAWLGWF